MNDRNQKNLIDEESLVSFASKDARLAVSSKPSSDKGETIFAQLASDSRTSNDESKMLKAHMLSASKLPKKETFGRGFGEDDAFCTAAGAMSPKPSSKYETGRLRSLFNGCDRA